MKMISETYLSAVFNLRAEIGEKTTCSISGNCMSPMIREGDSLVIEHGNQDFRVGDVVVYGSPGKFYAHRIVRIKDRGERRSFLLKGDRGNTFDDPITGDQILGKVIEVRGSNGHICFNSFFWKYLNYILSICSYIYGRRHNADSTFWKLINLLFFLKSKILPIRYSPGYILWKVISQVNRMKFYIQRYVFCKKMPVADSQGGLK